MDTSEDVCPESSTHVRLVGQVVRQPQAVYILQHKHHIARMEVDCDDDIVPVFGKEEIADAMSKLLTGTTVLIEGPLVVHQWKTGHSSPKSALEVEAQRVVVLDPPKEKKRDPRER